MIPRPLLLNFNVKRRPVLGDLVGSGVVAAVLEYLKSLRKEKSSTGGSVIPALGALALIYGLFLGAYMLAKFILHNCPSSGVTGETLLWVLSFAALVVIGWFVNTNYLGPHRMYRDRLMEAFMPDQESIRTNHWGLATDADQVGIDEVCQENRRPYHLINTNIVLADSCAAKYRGRSGDSFLLSPLYCGSDATGWRRSKDFMNAAPRTDDEAQDRRSGMKLSTAMAISGAALNPNAGVSGQGPTTKRFVSTLLSILGLRLGYWAPNPNPDHSAPGAKPNLWFPGLRGGVVSGLLDEKQDWVELSDGGHFESLGLYELVRRETDVIVVSDAGADPEFSFGDLANAVERCRVDFGAVIVFPDENGGEKSESGAQDRPLTDLIPSIDPKTRLDYKLAKRGHAVGTIYYPPKDGKPKKQGTLFYIKTTMVPELSADVYGYKNKHREFPDQSTADQFFDETQLEAYRELGYALGKQMCGDLEESIDGPPAGGPTATPPTPGPTSSPKTAPAIKKPTTKKRSAKKTAKKATKKTTKRK